MTELEKALEDAKKTGKLSVRFEALKQEVTKFSMDIQGVREGVMWSIRVLLGDGTSWTREAEEEQLVTLIKDFHAFFTKMGVERGRA